MPAPTNVDELLDLIRKSGVVEEKRLTAQLDRLRAANTLPAEPGKFAGLLVRDGVLTHFQAEQFLQGKWRRFNIGKYKVLERFGAGGMGSVYLCEHTLMRRRVAVKVLPAAKKTAEGAVNKAEETSSLERFYREARAVAALDHPNIVRAYDIDQDDNLHFLVMEHVDGSSLQEIIKRTGPMDCFRAAHYMHQSALGLQHAHESAGLVHRDIKPGNILVDRNGIVKILDMGLARFFHDDEDVLTKKYDESVLGTADYLAPEQALDSHSVDIRADIYSLGGTFYYCLTGNTPFTGGNVAQKLIWHQTRQPKKVREFRSDVPDELIAILDRMMAKNPVDRFQTPQELADALEPFTRTPIAPPPDAEMPTFSLAATQSLTPGEASMTAARAAASADPGSGKQWQINANAKTSTATPAPTSPAARQATSRPSPPPRQPVSPSTQRQPAAPTVRPPASAQPMRVEANLAPAPTSRPAAATPPPTPVTMPRTSRSEPNFSLDTSTSAEGGTDPAVEVDEDFGEDFPISRRSQPSSRRRSPRDTAPKKSRLPLIVGMAGTVVVLLAAVLIYFTLFAKPSSTSGDEQPVRAPIHVPGGVAGALSRAVRLAKDGDRILLDGDIVEADLTIKVPNLSIEPASGRHVTWSCPPSADPRSKLLIVSNVSGFRLSGITLDGLGKVESLLLLFGKCSGTKIDKVQFKNPGKYGVLLVNCAGTAEAPVLFSGGSIPTTKPTDSAVRFDLQNALSGLVKKNRHIAFRQVAFPGPGHKVTTADSASVDASTIELPPGITIEKAP